MSQIAVPFIFGVHALYIKNVLTKFLVAYRHKFTVERQVSCYHDKTQLMIKKNLLGVTSNCNVARLRSHEGVQNCSYFVLGLEKRGDGSMMDTTKRVQCLRVQSPDEIYEDVQRF